MFGRALVVVCDFKVDVFSGKLFSIVVDCNVSPLFFLRLSIRLLIVVDSRFVLFTIIKAFINFQLENLFNDFIFIAGIEFLPHV